LQQKPNQQKHSREGDDAARLRWVLQETTTTTHNPQLQTPICSFKKQQQQHPTLVLRQSSKPKASNPN
jgi:hypothetical protein